MVSRVGIEPPTQGFSVLLSIIKMHVSEATVHITVHNLNFYAV